MNSLPVLSHSERRLSLAARRAAVVALYGGYAAFWMLRLWGENLGSKALSIAALPCLLVTIGAAMLLFHKTGYWNWGNTPDQNLDEREVAERNRRYRDAYTGFAGAAFLALLYVDLAHDFGWWLPVWKRDGQWLMWGVLLLGLTLPPAFLAWNDRPLPEEE